MIKIEYLLMISILFGIIFFSVLTHHYYFIASWILPLLISEPVHNLIELPEHFNCDRQNNNVLVNTRTIKGSKFSRWLTNGNNYHVEHHLVPAIPIDKLYKIHALINASINNQCQSYFEFYKLALSKKLITVGNHAHIS